MDLNDAPDGCSLGDLPTRPMRVKILYTSDAESKTTCLARLPDIIHVPVVSIDEQSQLGIIDLQQCILAVTEASPEITSKLDNGDFAIYTFDYSESDVPLVGQGRLSARLAALESTQLTGQSSECMITGRVCKNVPFLFSNGVKETLEVKLRLIPISRPTYSSYGRVGESSRSSSPATSAGFDPNAWNSATKQARVQHPSTDLFDFSSGQANADANAALLADLFGPDSDSSGAGADLHQNSEMGIPETPVDSSFISNPAFAAHSRSAPGSRAGSPMMRHDNTAVAELARHQSFSGNPFPSGSVRPSSRVNITDESGGARIQSIDAHDGYQEVNHQAYSQNDNYYNEDGQPRKRAKVMQANWNGRSSFGAKSSDLRVNVATAASLQMYRPIPRRSTTSGRDLEPPPRAPTPIPMGNTRQRQQIHRNSRSVSMLRQASTAGPEFPSDNEMMSDANSSDGSSPGNSVTAGGTPLDFPSSPPVLQSSYLMQPSSPGHAASDQVFFADSGYMSERGFQSTIGPNCRDDDATLEASTTSITLPKPSNEINVQLEQPGDMNQLPQKMLLNLPHGRRDGTHRSHSPQTHSTQQNDPASRPATPLSRRDSLALPNNSIALSRSQSSNMIDGAGQARPSLQRTYTLAQDSEAGSPAPSEIDCGPRGTSRSGSSAPRRKVIQQRLEKSIANGETPIFCVHCGAIETPTWRRIYVKYCDGKPSPLDSAEGEGETIGIEVTERDNTTSEPIKFAIRKSMRKTKDSVIGEGFKETTVCNPCGLWFTKFRSMRPPNKWSRKSSSRKLKKAKTEDCPPTDGFEPPSDAFFTDQIMPEQSPDAEPSVEPTTNANTARGVSNESTGRRRANSLQMQLTSDTQHANADVLCIGAEASRAVQSSPARFQGSQTSPIELDLTPKPTRRLLFPSPRQSGEMKTLEGADLLYEKANFIRGSAKSSSSTKSINITNESNLNIFDAFTSEKENLAPLLDGMGDLAHLFDGSPGALLRTPVKKTPSKKSPSSGKQNDHLLQTPTPGSRKRRILTPGRSHTSENNNNGGAATAADFMTSPSSSRYFLRSTPSRLVRTPGGSGGVASRNSVSGSLQEISPFSRQLAQMLCDNDVSMGSLPIFTSPSRQYDFSDLPTFTSPSRDNIWKGIDDLLSSDFASCDSQNQMRSKEA